MHRAILTYQLHASVLTRLQAACCLSQQNMDDKQSHHRIIIEKQDLHACKLDLLGSRQKVVPKLLTCVHALVVVHRVLVAHSLNVKGARQPLINVCR